MDTRRTTNILLFLIFLALTAILLTRTPIGQVSAETLKLDNCITEAPYERPAGYVHVIMHDVSPIQN